MYSYVVSFSTFLLSTWLFSYVVSFYTFLLPGLSISHSRGSGSDLLLCPNTCGSPFLGIARKNEFCAGCRCRALSRCDALRQVCFLQVWPSWKENLCQASTARWCIAVSDECDDRCQPAFSLPRSHQKAGPRFAELWQAHNLPVQTWSQTTYPYMFSMYLKIYICICNE